MASSDENLKKIAEACSKDLRRTYDHWLHGTQIRSTPSHHYYVVGDLSYYGDCKDLEFLDITICPQRRR